VQVKPLAVRPHQFRGTAQECGEELASQSPKPLAREFFAGDIYAIAAQILVDYRLVKTIPLPFDDIRMVHQTDLDPIDPGLQHFLNDTQPPALRLRLSLAQEARSVRVGV